MNDDLKCIKLLIERNLIVVYADYYEGMGKDSIVFIGHPCEDLVFSDRQKTIESGGAIGTWTFISGEMHGREYSNDIFDSYAISLLYVPDMKETLRYIFGG